jgi:MFS family permease
VVVDDRVGLQAGNETATPSGVVSVVPIDEPEVMRRSGATERALPFLMSLAAVVLTYWTIDIISPALPDIKDDLALSAAGTGLVFSLLFLGRLIANLPAAYLVDQIGAAVTASAGGAVLVTGSLAALLAPDQYVLYPARVLQGIGISLLVTAALRSVLRAKPGQGAAMTYFGFAATLGGILGLQSGGFLTEAYSWRAIFVLAAAIAVVLTIAPFVSRHAGDIGSRETAKPKAASERDEAPPVAEGSIAPPLILNFCVFFNYSIWASLPLYTERRFDASAEANANLLLVITLMHLIAAFPAGRAIRKWGGRRTLVAGLAIAIVGTLLVLPAPGMVWLSLPLALYGVGMVAAANAGGDIVLQRGGLSGRAVGMVRLSSDLGLVVGPYVTGALTDAFGYRTPFIALPVVCATAALLGVRDRTINRVSPRL